MTDQRVTQFTEYLRQAVMVAQAGIALFLVVVLFIGVVNLLSTFLQAVQTFEILGYKNAIGLINTTIDIVLYLFIIIEIFRTIVAYVEAQNVVKAVIHAGLIAVIRQIIIFKPQDVESIEQAILLATVYLLLLLGLFLGFFLVHWMDEE